MQKLKLRELKSNAGFTLVEMMIAVMIGGVVLVMAMGMLLNISGTAKTFGNSVDSEIEQLQAANTLQNMFTQATELKYFTGPPMETYVDVAGQGAIREYDSDADFGLKVVSTLAVFMRDDQHSTATSPAGLISNLVPTAVFFQAPTPTTFGVLYISTSSPPKPTRKEIHFDGLTHVEVKNINTYSPYSATNPVTGDLVTSFDFVLTFRRFLGPAKPDQMKFCPQSNLAACPGIGAFRDVVRSYRMAIRNNVLAISPGSKPAPACPTTRTHV